MAGARIEMRVVAENRAAALDDEADQPLAERKPRLHEAVRPAALGDEREHHALVGLGLGDQDARDGNQMADGLDEALETWSSSSRERRSW